MEGSPPQTTASLVQFVGYQLLSQNYSHASMTGGGLIPAGLIAALATCHEDGVPPLPTAKGTAPPCPGCPAPLLPPDCSQVTLRAAPWGQELTWVWCPSTHSALEGWSAEATLPLHWAFAAPGTRSPTPALSEGSSPGPWCGSLSIQTTVSGVNSSTFPSFFLESPLFGCWVFLTKSVGFFFFF